MPRTAAQNAMIRDESQELLLQAATAVFTRMGYGPARMADIAREAGVSHGLAYRYFPTKDAMYVAVVDAVTEGAGRLVTEVEELPQSPIGHLREICARMLEGARESPAFVLIMLQAASSGAVPEQARDTLRRSALKVESGLAKLIAEAQAAGQTGAGDPNVLARALASTVCGMTAAEALGPTGVPRLGADVLMRLLAPTEALPPEGLEIAASGRRGGDGHD